MTEKATTEELKERLKMFKQLRDNCSGHPHGIANRETYDAHIRNIGDELKKKE